MEGIFAEFENENTLRNYPFAAGCLFEEDADSSIPAGLFVDAVLYPVNPVGAVYLSGISEDGVFSVSDDTGVIMSGTADGSTVELFDLSEFKRHVGTLVAGSEGILRKYADLGVTREYDAQDTSFASSCVFPVVLDGVLSLKVGELNAATGDIGFANGPDDDVRVSGMQKEDGRMTLRFDVLPRPGVDPSESIRRIICVVDGQTPFRIEKLAYNTVLLRLNNVDKEIVCSAAHRENSLEMADTCSCEKDPTVEREELEEAYQLEEVFIPPDTAQGHPEGGIDEGADNAFFLVVPNLTGYDNPISITLEDGTIAPKTEQIKATVNGNDAELKDDELIDATTSNGIVIQVPGLSGGMI